MEIGDALELFESYNLWLIIIGLSILATTILPRLLGKFPLSMPILVLALGYAAVALPFGLDAPQPKEQVNFAEHLTELGVIISLMGAGLKIDRKISFKGWGGTWRLLSITMVLTIAATALIGWWIAAFVPATAMLLGAAIAPTDPVLASEVQVGSPGKGGKDKEAEEGEDVDEVDDKVGEDKEDELRFCLTSEAGLNDGLAFPFTNMAVAMAMVGGNPENWFGTWLLIDVFYKIIVGIIVGVGFGYWLGHFILSVPAKTKLAKEVTGLGALAATLLIYGLTEMVSGYGFIATFVGALMIRNFDRDHHYHEVMHILTEKAERILTAGILLALGGAIAGGLLDPLTWPLILSGLLIIFVVRPVAGLIGLIGFKRAPWRERLAISFLGIRGIGSIYYLAYALNKEQFPGTDEIWALVAFIIVTSTLIHGITATPITSKLDQLRQQGP